MFKFEKLVFGDLGWGDEFLCATYKKVFDETWDKRIEDAINEIKEKENQEKETKKKQGSASNKSKASKKQQLIELKELLDEELITKEEFDESRKKILGL